MRLVLGGRAFFIVFLWFLVFFSGGSYALEKEGPYSYRVDTKKSVLMWTGKKLTGTHHGGVKIKKGKVFFVGGLLVGGRVFVDMQSIENKDIKNPKWRQKLVDHLHSPDFFATKKYPESWLDVILCVADGSGERKGYRCQCDLTIKGVTQKVAIHFEINGNTLEGSFSIDRSQFGMTYRSQSFPLGALSNMVILDEIDFKFSLAISRD